MATVSCCSYGETDSGDTIATYYATSEQYKRMADFLVGAAAHVNVKSPILLALGSLEAGGPGNNWLQMGSTAISDFQTFWSDNNHTGQSTVTSSQVTGIDSINAAAAALFYASEIQSSYSGYQALVDASSRWNGICNACTSPPYTTGYGWTSMFLAFGADYSSVSSIDYAGASYVTGPTGTITRYLLCGSSAQLTVPSATARGVRTTPYGRNGNGRQIVLLAGNDDAYVSGLQVTINLYGSGAVQAVVTTDATFAAECTQSTDVCVVAAGSQAVTNINNAASSLGITAESFANFADWQASSTFGYVNAAGSTAEDTYTLANTAASDATTAGW